MTAASRRDRTWLTVALLLERGGLDLTDPPSYRGRTTGTYGLLRDRARRVCSRRSVKREHGTAFDRLVDEAREQLYGADPAAVKSLSA